MLALKPWITQSRQRHMERCGIVIESVRVGIAGDIQPVHRHALAVTRRSEQAIDGSGVGCFAVRFTSCAKASSSAGEGAVR